MPTPSVLISGAGIAGSTLAYWLGRYGIGATVVERASDLRSSGNPVDVRDEAVAVATASPETGVLMSPLKRLNPARKVLRSVGLKMCVSSAVTPCRRENT